MVDSHDLERNHSSCELAEHVLAFLYHFVFMVARSGLLTENEGEEPPRSKLGAERPLVCGPYARCGNCMPLTVTFGL